MKSEAAPYVVIARKWRPQQFEDVVGQKSITQTLQNAIRANRVGHAFIFSGPRGVGKTTTARILARALNCHQGPTPEPCGACASCLEVAGGGSLDVLEIDAASNTGVDNIRELREAIQYRPARDRFKIFIIDEVHMLSTAAFNALLKTLEEPPEHVKFVMATTEAHRIPATILSRCQQFDFKLISYQQIMDRLRLIAHAEEIRISDYALGLICGASEGSMRDAQSTLDQILAYSGREVRDEDARSLLGVVTEESLNTVVTAIIDGDRRALLDQLDQIAKHGYNLQVFCRKLLEQIRHLLVIKAAGCEVQMFAVSSSQMESLQRQVKHFSEIDLIRIYDLLFQAESELRWHPHPLFHLEVTLLKILQLEHLEEIERLLSRMAAAERGPGGLRTAAPVEEENAKSAASQGRPSESEPDWEPISAEGGPVDEASNSNPKIRTLLEAVQRERPTLSAFLEKAQIDMDGERLLIRFAGNQKVSRQFVEEPSNLDFLRRVWEETLGSPVQIEIAVPQGGTPSRKVHRAMEDPRVQLFTKAFPGKISVEDLDGENSS